MAPARAQVREALLAAARAELVEHGRAAISLRAVARRAGLSHASPNTTSATGPVAYRDRHGGVSWACAHPVRGGRISRPTPTCGTRTRLHRLRPVPPGPFRVDVHARRIARRRPGTHRCTAAGHRCPDHRGESVRRHRLDGIGIPPELALISWALVHGLVVLTRDGALQAAATAPVTDSAELAHTLADCSPSTSPTTSRAQRLKFPRNPVCGKYSSQPGHKLPRYRRRHAAATESSH